MKSNWYFIVIALVSLSISLLLFPSYGTGDMHTWVNIIDTIKTRETTHLLPECLNYRCEEFNTINYPPVHYLLFFLFVKLLPVSSLTSYMAVKLLILIFYLLTLGAILLFNSTIRTVHQNSLPILKVLFVYFTLLSLILNTQGLAYTDILVFPFFIFSIVCVAKRKFFLSGMFFSISFLIKWQPLMLLPIFVLYILKIPASPIWKRLGRFGLGICAPVVALLLINNEVIEGIRSLRAISVEPFLSAALNVQWMTTYVLHTVYPYIFDPLEEGYIIRPIDIRILPYSLTFLLLIPKIIFLLIYGTVCILYFLHKKRHLHAFPHFLTTLLLTFSSYFMISSGVHENHFQLGLLIALLLYLSSPRKKNRLLLFIVDVFNFINMFVFGGFTGKVIGDRLVFGLDITLPIAILFSLGYAFFLSKMLAGWLKRYR